jgi:IPT/TIG domain
VADDELTRELLDLIQSSRETAPDDERGWLQHSTRAERRVVADFGDLETDLRGPSETGTAIDREGLRPGTPKITKVEPSDFGPGTLVTIHGKNLFGVGRVLFDDKPAEQLVIVSGQRIEAVVPDDAQSSAITIELRPSRRQRQQALQRQQEAAETAGIDEEEEEEDESFEAIVVYSGTGEDDEIEEIEE